MSRRPVSHCKIAFGHDPLSPGHFAVKDRDLLIMLAAGAPTPAAAYAIVVAGIGASLIWIGKVIPLTHARDE